MKLNISSLITTILEAPSEKTDITLSAPILWKEYTFSCIKFYICWFGSILGTPCFSMCSRGKTKHVSQSYAAKQVFYNFYFFDLLFTKKEYNVSEVYWWISSKHLTMKIKPQPIFANHNLWLYFVGFLFWLLISGVPARVYPAKIHFWVVCLFIFLFHLKFNQHKGCTTIHLNNLTLKRMNEKYPQKKNQLIFVCFEK